MSGWVSFEEGGNISGGEVPAIAPRKHKDDSVTHSDSEGSRKISSSWVNFEELAPIESSTPTTSGTTTDHGGEPQAQRAVVPQHTGGSVHSGVLSQASDDHQSAVASSVVSSRGSFSGSHENISSSREYMPLESSSPKPASVTPISGGWVRFDSSHRVVSSTPIKAAQEKGTSQNGSVDSSRVSSPAPANWVQFAGENPQNLSSTSPALSSSCDNSWTLDPPSSDDNAKDKSEPLDIPSKQPVHANFYQRDIKNKDAKLKTHLKTPSTVSSTSTPVHMTDHANDLEVSMFSAVASDSEKKCEPQSPGNPFKADMLTLKQLEKQKAMDEQMRRTVSPYNPFLNMGQPTPDKTSDKANANKIWTTFDEPDSASSNSQVLSSSPGNPFAEMTVTANVNTRPPVAQPFTPQQYQQQQQGQGQVIFAAAAAVQQSLAAAQPVRQIMAVQPLPQSSTVPADQRTSALLSPVLFASQPVSPISMKPNQWQQQPQQFFPATSSPQSVYPTTQNITAGKQSLAAIVAPTTAAADVPGSGKLNRNTRTSIRSNLSSPSSEKIIFEDQYPREQLELSEGWPLKLRCPDKKKIAGSRHWQPVHARLSEGNVLQLFHDRTRKEPFRELPLQCNYELGLQNLQQFDVKGKIHTIKLLYMSYKEKRKVGAKSMFGKEAHLEQLMKLGSLDFKVFRSFVYAINDALMKLTLYQDRGAHYQQDMVSVVVSDECRCLINANGDVAKQSITVNINVLSFLSVSPDCAIGLNDVQVKGLDVVARQHIIPNKTSDWIQLHNVELHKCAKKNVFVDSRMIEFQPINACRFRLMQFQVLPAEEQDLPLHVKAVLSGEGTHLELRVDLLLPACTGKRNPTHYTCENILVIIPIPDYWISYFRKAKRMGQSSVHAVNKRPDLIKRGSLNPKLLEISVGTAKYEHAFRALVWRIDKLPERTTGHPSTHLLKCHLNLSSQRELTSTMTSRPIEVEYHTPHTTASKTTVRSLAICSERPAEKRVRYMSSYEYQVQIEDNYTRRGDDHPNSCVQQ